MTNATTPASPAARSPGRRAEQPGRQAGQHSRRAEQIGRWAPHRLADAAMARANRRAELRCAQNAEWAAIERRRRTSTGTDTRVLLSEELDLDWADFERQQRIRARVAPDPLWMPLARFVSRRPLRLAAGHLLAVAQRAQRGWSDRDVWNADVHLCRVTAGMLRCLATNGIGWPDRDYATPEEWSTALRTRASALEAWADVTARGIDDPAVEERALRDAQEAFRWVADNLPSLWD